MKRRDLEQHLRAHACRFHHHGGRHDFWFNPKTQGKASVPRHSDIPKGTVRSICRTLHTPLPSNL